jgi:hypothetical protein
MEGVIFWSAMKSVKRRYSRLFVFISRRSALIIPKRAFDTDSSFADFAAAIESRWTAQKGR